MQVLASRWRWYLAAVVLVVLPLGCELPDQAALGEFANELAREALAAWLF